MILGRRSNADCPRRPAASQNWPHGCSPPERKARTSCAPVIRLASERESVRVAADRWGMLITVRTTASTVVEILRKGEADLPGAFARAKEIVHLTNSGPTDWHGLGSKIAGRLRSAGCR